MFPWGSPLEWRTSSCSGVSCRSQVHVFNLRLKPGSVLPLGRLRLTLRVVQAGRGTCASAPWPPACRSSSWRRVRRSPSTTCCCRPSSCGWSSCSAPSCSASTAWSSCWDSSPCPPSPGALSPRVGSECEEVCDLHCSLQVQSVLKNQERSHLQPRGTQDCHHLCCFCFCRSSEFCK